jgi:hypothetical protein
MAGMVILQEVFYGETMGKLKKRKTDWIYTRALVKARSFPRQRFSAPISYARG